jgi:hypothetical protein
MCFGVRGRRCNFDCTLGPPFESDCTSGVPVAAVGGAPFLVEREDCLPNHRDLPLVEPDITWPFVSVVNVHLAQSGSRQDVLDRS